MRKKITKSTGNIFRDIGVTDPQGALIRCDLMINISKIIKERGMTQKEAGQLLGLPQSKISLLMNEKFRMFSIDHLIRILNTLEQDVEIIIKPKVSRKKKGITKVCVEG